MIETLRVPRIVIRQVDPRSAGRAALLLQEYFDWVLTLEDFAKDAPVFCEMAREITDLCGVYQPPKGCFLVASQGNNLVGCIALCRRSHTAVEIRRLYVRDVYRSKGIGSQLVRKAVALADAMRYQKIFLESHVSMKAAHRIYADAGFLPVPPPQQYDTRLAAAIQCMELALRSGARERSD